MSYCVPLFSHHCQPTMISHDSSSSSMLTIINCKPAVVSAQWSAPRAWLNCCSSFGPCILATHLLNVKLHRGNRKTTMPPCFFDDTRPMLQKVFVPNSLITFVSVANGGVKVKHGRWILAEFYHYKHQLLQPELLHSSICTNNMQLEPIWTN